MSPHAAGNLPTERLHHSAGLAVFWCTCECSRRQSAPTAECAPPPLGVFLVSCFFSRAFVISPRPSDKKDSSHRQQNSAVFMHTARHSRTEDGDRQIHHGNVFLRWVESIQSSRVAVTKRAIARAADGGGRYRPPVRRRP